MIKEVTLPIEMATPALEIDEIGVLFILMCMPYLEKDVSMSWGKNETFLKILNTMVDKQIVFPNNNNGTLEVEVDISNL